MSGHQRIAGLRLTLMTTGLVAATGVATAAPPLDRNNKNAQPLTLQCGNETLTGTTIAHSAALIITLTPGGTFVIVQVLDNAGTPLFTIPGAVASKDLLDCTIDIQPGRTFRGFVAPGS